MYVNTVTYQIKRIFYGCSNMSIGCEDGAAIGVLPLSTISKNRNPELQIQKLPCFIIRY